MFPIHTGISAVTDLSGKASEPGNRFDPIRPTAKNAIRLRLAGDEQPEQQIEYYTWSTGKDEDHHQDPEDDRIDAEVLAQSTADTGDDAVIFRMEFPRSFPSNGIDLNCSPS